MSWPATPPRHSFTELQRSMRSLVDDVAWLDGFEVHATPEGALPSGRLATSRRLLGALASAIECHPNLADDLAKDGRAVELWDALHRLHGDRRALAEALRRFESCVGADSQMDFETGVRHLMTQVRACDDEERRLLGRAFWLDLGTID